MPKAKSGKVSGKRERRDRPVQMAGPAAPKSRKSPEDLRRSEALFRKIFENGPLGMIIVGTDFRFFQANATFCRMVGYGKEELRKLSFEDVTKTKHTAADLKQLNKVVRGEIPFYRTEKRYIRKDGTPVWGSATISLAPDGAGEPPRLLGLIEDISDRKRAENELIDSRLRYKRIFENAPVGIFHTLPDGRIVRANPMAGAMLRYDSPEELIATVTDLATQLYVHSGDREKFLRKVRGTNGWIGVEMDFRRKDGSVLTAVVTTRKVPDRHGSTAYFEGFLEDITERKRIERGLEESLQRYEGLFENIGSGVAVYEAVSDGEDFVIRNFNPAAERIEGIDRREIIGRSVREVFPGVVEMGLFEAFRRVWKTGTPEYLPAAVYREGTLVSWRDNRVFKIPSGEIVAVYDDVMAQKRAEQELFLAHDRMSATLKAVPDLLFELDSAGRFINYVAPSEGELYVSPESFIGKSIEEVLPERAAAIIRGALEEAARKGHVRGAIYELDMPSGSRCFELSVARTGGSEPHFIATARDITDRVRIEETLRQSEEASRVLLDSMPVTVLVHRDNRIAYINKAGQSRFGYAEEEIRGRPLYDFLAEESRPLVADRIRRRVAGEKVDDYEVNIRSRTGEPMTAIVRAIPIQFEGRPAVLVSLTEITERKKMERTLEASLHEKEALLRELYHRTKNNMQVICAMLALHSSSAGDAKVTRVFQEMENRIMSMALVHQKLYQSRNLDRIDLRDYFRELSELLLRSYKVSRTRIALPLEMGEIEVAIDVAIPLGLILNELISNSLKHAFPGERDGEIRIRLRAEDGEMAVLEVSDNGVGVPPDFDFRKEGRMGLQSVFATAEHQLQGRVEFSSEGGVKFRLRFPLAQGGKPGDPR